MSSGYTEAQKALALEILARHNNEVTSVALNEVRVILQTPDLPKTTVWRWLQRRATEKSLASPEAREKAAKALDKMFEDTARQYLDHAQREDIIRKVPGASAITAAAIATDKMRLLRGLPTEYVQILPAFIAATQRHGVDGAEIMRAAINALDEQKVEVER